MYISLAFCDNFASYANAAINRYVAAVGEEHRTRVLMGLEEGSLVFAVAPCLTQMDVVEKRMPARGSTWCEGNPVASRGAFAHA